MRYMGGLRRYMPVTWITMIIGTLALIGTPFFSGFYSKDSIIEAAALNAHASGHWIATYGYWAVLAGVLVTSFYSFRLLYLTFHGAPRWDRKPHDPHAAHDDHHHQVDAAHPPHESPWVVTLPLVLLAIPSVAIGFFTVGPMLFGTDWSGHDGQPPFFAGAIRVLADNDMLAVLAREFHGPVAFALHAWQTPAFWLTVAGFLLATLMYLVMTDLPAKLARAFAWPKRILEEKYGFDRLWIDGFAGGGVRLGGLSRLFDSTVIDGLFVNGSARMVDLAAGVVRRSQSGFLFHYAFVMILGLIALLAVLIRWWT